MFREKLTKYSIGKKDIAMAISVTVAVVASLVFCAIIPQVFAEEEYNSLEKLRIHYQNKKKDQPREVLPIKDARLKIELNATDGDAGIQVFIDSEPWKSIKIYDPNGRLVFRSVTRGRFARQGGTELFLESAEPDFSELPLEEFLERFPEGEYVFVGKGLDNERYIGTAFLNHNLPDGPNLVFPLENDELQDPNDTIVMWEPVGPANGSDIIAYQVLVVQAESGFNAIPKVVLDIMMPATATSMAVPPGFLLPDTEYEWEVLAIEEGGNQTLSSSFFHTKP